LTETVFARSVTGACRAIQPQSTNLSTDFCGYRNIHYRTASRDDAATAIVALRKLAVAARGTLQGKRLFAIIQAAGWPIWPLLLASIIAVALIIERSITLRGKRIVPPTLLEQVISVYQRQGVSEEVLDKLSRDSPLGTVLAAGLRNHKSSRYVMKEAIEEAGRSVAHRLERFLTTLGTIATAAPLLGLFGTVIGMIEIFGSQSPSGANPQQLAHGISIALYNTAFGIAISIPALIFYRHFKNKVDTYVVEMELQASKLVDLLHGERSDFPAPPRRGA
jgi:biopolymer transport protein ExbB